MTFTEYVRSYCKKYGITGYELSKKTGLSTTYCYNLLNGTKDNPSFKVMQMISYELGVNYADFIYGNKIISSKPDVTSNNLINTPSNNEASLTNNANDDEVQIISLNKLKELGLNI